MHPVAYPEGTVSNGKEGGAVAASTVNYPRHSASRTPVSAEMPSAVAQYGVVSELAGRAEDIAAHLVSHALGADARKFDADGRQSAVDFVLEWPNGRRGALEVTLVTQPESSAWQGLAAKEGWRWPAPSGWEFRPSGDDMPYRRARRAVVRAVELCDREGVYALDQLHPDIFSSDPDLEWLSDIGDLRRTSFKPGVVLLPAVRAEFVGASTSDFATLIEGWLRLPHCHVTSKRLDRLALLTRGISF